ncbi:MAG: hypothetical protein R2837_10505 [Aliarcobacter sp.]
MKMMFLNIYLIHGDLDLLAKNLKSGLESFILMLKLQSTHH